MGCIASKHPPIVPQYNTKQVYIQRPAIRRPINDAYISELLKNHKRDYQMETTNLFDGNLKFAYLSDVFPGGLHTPPQGRTLEELIASREAMCYLLPTTN